MISKWSFRRQRGQHRPLGPAGDRDRQSGRILYVWFVIEHGRRRMFASKGRDAQGGVDWNVRPTAAT